MQIHSKAKNLIVYFSVLLLMNNTTTTAQKADTTKSKGLTFSINPLQLAFGEVRVQLEKPFTKKTSGEVIMSYVYYNLNSNNTKLHSFAVSTNNNNYLLSTTIGGKIGFGYKYYLNKGEESGSYLSPLLFYKFLDYTNFRLVHASLLGIKTNAIYYHIISLQFQYCFYRPWMGNGALVNYYFGIGMRYKYGIALQESTRPEVVIPTHRTLESWFYPTINIGINFGIDSSI